jgi:hypothetical protein
MTRLRTRIGIAVAVVALSGAFIAVGAIVTNKQWEAALITIGCELLLFVPLAFLEPVLTAPLRRAEDAANLAQSAATEARDRIEALELSNPAFERAADEADKRAAAQRSSEQELAQKARELDPTALSDLLAEGQWIGTLSRNGVFAAIPATSPHARRHWYLRVLFPGPEGVALRLLNGGHQVGKMGKLANRSRAGDVVTRLRNYANSENQGAPPPGEAMIAALETIVSLMIDVRLGQSDREFPYRNLLAAVARGWALDHVGQLVSLDSDSPPIDIDSLSSRLALRLKGVPHDVLKAAVALNEIAPGAIS